MKQLNDIKIKIYDNKKEILKEDSLPVITAMNFVETKIWNLKIHSTRNMF